MVFDEYLWLVVFGSFAAFACGWGNGELPDVAPLQRCFSFWLCHPVCWCHLDRQPAAVCLCLRSSADAAVFMQLNTTSICFWAPPLPPPPPPPPPPHPTSPKDLGGSIFNLYLQIILSWWFFVVCMLPAALALVNVSSADAVLCNIIRISVFECTGANDLANAFGKLTYPANWPCLLF